MKKPKAGFDYYCDKCEKEITEGLIIEIEPDEVKYHYHEKCAESTSVVEFVIMCNNKGDYSIGMKMIEI